VRALLPRGSRAGLFGLQRQRCVSARIDLPSTRSYGKKTSVHEFVYMPVCLVADVPAPLKSCTNLARRRGWTRDVRGRVEEQRSSVILHQCIRSMGPKLTMSPRCLRAKSSRKRCSDRQCSQFRGVVQSRSLADCDQRTRMLERLWHQRYSMRSKIS
jgi:hypothetical protein